MSRLIDADELKEKLNKMFPDTLSKDAENVFVSVMMVLEEQPTAYDVDAVKEKLENTIDDVLDKCIAQRKSYVAFGLELALEVVKKGGVE